jgi:hypothetical protein
MAGPSGAGVLQVVLSLAAGGTERLVIETVRRLRTRYRMAVCCLDNPGLWAEEVQREGIEVITALLKHLGLWLVKTRPTPKAHAPPALNQNGSGLAGYILDHFSPLPMNDDHLYPAKRGTTPGMLTFSRKDQEYGAGGTGVPR